MYALYFIFLYLILLQDKRLTAVRGKKYLQVAKNRYSGDLGIVPLDFDKESLSYQPKKKSKMKQDEPDKLLNKCFEEFSVDQPHYVEMDDNIQRRDASHKQKFRSKKDVDSYLSDILNSNRTR